MAVQTPATTAKADLRAFYADSRGRKKRIGSRTIELRDAAVESEDLMGLYQTDPAAAIARYEEIKIEAREQALSENPVVVVSEELRKQVNRARTLRGNTQRWRHTYSDEFDEQMDASIGVVSAEIAKGKALISWFRDCIPTIEQFTGVEGKVAFTDDDVIQSSNFSNVTSPASEVYGSIVSAFGVVLSRWEDMVEAYELELELADVDPIGDIISTVEGLGLQRVHEDADDGYLWFVDPETSELYFMSLVNRAALGVSVLDYGEIRSSVSMMDNWKSLWHVDLSITAIIWAQGEIDPYDRVPRVYGTMYDKLKSWIQKSIEAGNTPPAFYPTDLIR